MKEINCKLCNKSLSDEKICPYCHTSIDEELVDISPGTFKKLTNSVKSIFGKGLSKDDKIRFEKFLEDKDPLIEFIEKYSKTPTLILKDKSSSIKEEYQNKFNTSTEILEYNKNNEFYLNLEDKKIIYRFRRTFEELDDIIFNLNSTYSSNAFKEKQESLKEFYKNFEDEIPKSLFENEDIEEIKSKNKDTYDIFKEINEFNETCKNNLLNDDDLKVLKEFINDYENIDSKIEDLNCNFRINEKIIEINKYNSIITKEIDTNQDISLIKSNLNNLEKEKEDYAHIFNVSNNILENYSHKLDLDSKKEVESFQSNYNKLDDFINELNLVIDNSEWLKENNSKFDDLNKLSNKEISRYIEDEDLSNLKEKNKLILDRINDIEKLSPNLTDTDIIKEFKSNYDNLDRTVKRLNDNFWIKDNKEKLNNFINLKDKDADFSISEGELINLKSKNSYNFKKANELKTIYDHDSTYINQQDIVLLESFIQDYNNIDSIAEDLNDKFKINTILNKIYDVDIDSVLSIEDLKIQLIKLSDLYSSSQNLLEENSKFLDFNKKETIKTFIAYYENLDFQIVQKEIDIYKSANLEKIEDFNNIKYKEIKCEISASQKEKIYNEYQAIHSQTLDIVEKSKRFDNIKFDFRDSCTLFIDNFNDFDFIIDYVNAKIWFKDNITKLMDLLKLKIVKIILVKINTTI